MWSLMGGRSQPGQGGSGGTYLGADLPGHDPAIWVQDAMFILRKVYSDDLDGQQ